MAKASDPLIRFGAAVRTARTAARLTQEAYAERCELSVPYISNIERGTQEAGLMVIGKLAAGLGLQGSQLLRRAKL